MSDLAACCVAVGEELGVDAATEIRSATLRTGGAASDIARIEFANGSICVKFAPPKLKATADRRAPVCRNTAEYAWREVVTRARSQASARFFGHTEEPHGLAIDPFGDPVVNLVDFVPCTDLKLKEQAQ